MMPSLTFFPLSIVLKQEVVSRIVNCCKIVIRSASLKAVEENLALIERAELSLGCSEAGDRRWLSKHPYLGLGNFP